MSSRGRGADNGPRQQRPPASGKTKARTSKTMKDVHRKKQQTGVNMGAFSKFTRNGEAMAPKPPSKKQRADETAANARPQNKNLTTSMRQSVRSIRDGASGGGGNTQQMVKSVYYVNVSLTSLTAASVST